MTKDDRQGSLFDICRNNHGENQHSEKANTSMVECKSGLRLKVLEFIRECGSYGATCEEIERGLGMSHQTASARCAELKKYNMVTIAAFSRFTKSGRSASVLIERRGVTGGRKT